MSLEDKLLDGQRLSEQQGQIILAEIREQLHDATEAQCLKILRERVELAKQLGDKY